METNDIYQYQGLGGAAPSTKNEEEKEILKTCEATADLVIDGTLVDNKGGSTHFQIAFKHPNLGPKFVHVKKIGKHNFFKET